MPNNPAKAQRPTLISKSVLKVSVAGDLERQAMLLGMI